MKAGIRTAYKNWLALVWSLVAAAMLWLPAVASAQTQTLTLPGPSNNQQNVLMFDVHAVNALTVTGLSTAMDSAGTQTYQIYGRTGTHVGNTDSLTGWTLLGTSAPLTAANPDDVVDLGVVLNVAVPAGQTHALMLRTSTDTSPLVGYMNAASAVGGVAAADANLQVLVGTGASWDFSTNYSPRQLVGAVRYQLETAPAGQVQAVPTLSQWMLLGLALMLGGLAWRQRRGGH